MKNWKKQWKQELDAILPDLSPAVRQEPIPNGPKKTKVLSPKKWSISSISAAACIAVMILAGILFGGQLFPSENDFVVSAVTLEINPEVTFITDENGTVSTVISLNSDADLILSDDARLAELVNIPLATAVERFVEYAAKAGFLDLNAPDAVRLSATGDCAEEWLTASHLAVEGYFSEMNIPSVVLSEFVELERFCERSGIEAMSTKEALEAWTKNTSSLLVAREGENKEESTLHSTYRTDIIEGICKEELLLSIQSYSADLLAIDQLYLRIFAISFSDYFSIKENGLPPFLVSDPEEVNRLVAEMDTALADFTVKYNKVIDSREALAAETENVAETVAGLLAEFSRLWESSIDDALGFMQMSGFSVNARVQALLEANPIDAESFLSAMKDAYTFRFDSLTAAAENTYTADRSPVDPTLKEQLIAQYGSLEAFFNQKNQ